MATSHFFVGGGAEHTAEMVRRHSYAVIGGAEGVCEPDDLQVLPLSTIGPGVRVTIGSAFMTSRYAGAVRESYMGSVTQQETVQVPATGSGGPRRDLIILRARDPYVQGSPWEDPGAGITDPEVAEDARAGAQYMFVERISGVPAGTRRIQDVPGHENDTAYTLARIDIPASTGAITSAMITNLRSMHTPRVHRVFRPVDLTSVQRLSSTSAYPDGGVSFPSEFNGSAGMIDIPAWATHARISMTWGSVLMPSNADARGYIWVQIGQNVDPDRRSTPPGSFDSDATGNSSRETWVLGATISISPILRGTSKWFFPKASLMDSVPTNRQPYLNTTSSCILDVEFYQETD